MWSSDDDPLEPGSTYPILVEGRYVAVRLRCVSTAFQWSEHPGVDYWTAELCLGHADTGDEAVIATTELCRIYRPASADATGNLESVNADLQYVSGQILWANEILDERGLGVGSGGTLLIATDVAVDRSWRGHRLGPALVVRAADMLRADAVFVVAVAMATKLNSRGVCVPFYDGREPDPAATNKVRQAWYQTGFRDLRGDVMWIETGPNSPLRPASFEIDAWLRQVPDLATRPDLEQWWQERTDNSSGD